MPRKYAHFRIGEDKARRWLPPDAGRILNLDSPGPVRAVDAEVGGQLYQTILDAERLYWQRDESFFAGWDIRRKYSKAEIAKAELFHWLPTHAFEPAGEELSEALYDYSRACPICRVGRRQARDLVLDLGKVPRKDVAISIGMEMVVSERFVDVVTRAGITGISLRPVHHYRRTTTQTTPRWQLVLPAPSARVLIPPTEFGVDPADDDPDGTYLCPNGHTAGLNLLSEVFLSRSSWSGADIAATVEHTGNPWPADASLSRSERSYGLQVPRPIVLISPRLRTFLTDNKLTGWRADVAYLH